MKVKVERAPIYTYLFDKKAVGWSNDSVTNRYYLLIQQNYANEKLKAFGRLYLNEVFDMLGMPRTKAGQVVGWIYEKDNLVGDNFVDFGLDQPRTGVNGAIPLRFNVDGDILSRL